MAMKSLDHTAEKSSTTSPWTRLLRSLSNPRIANSLLNINVITRDFGLVVSQILGGISGWISNDLLGWSKTKQWKMCMWDEQQLSR